MVGKRKPKQKTTDKKNNANSLPCEASRRTRFTCIKGPDLDLQPQYGYFTSSNVTLQEFSFKNRVLRVHLNKCSVKDLTTPRRFRSTANKKQLGRKGQRNSKKRFAETNSSKTFSRKVPEFRNPKVDSSVPHPKTVKKEKKQIPKLKKPRTFKSVLNPKSVRKGRKPVSAIRTPRSHRKKSPIPKGIETKRKNSKSVPEIQTSRIRTKTSTAPKRIETVRKERKPVSEVRTLRNGRKVSPAPNGTKTVKQVSEVGTLRSSGRRSLSLYGVNTALIERVKRRKHNQTFAINNQLITKKQIVKLTNRGVKHLDNNRNLRRSVSDTSKLQTNLELQQRKRGRPRKAEMPIIQDNSESTLDASLNRLKIKPQVFKEEPKLNYKFQKLVSDVKTMKLPTLEWKIKVIIRDNKISAIRFTNKSAIERSVSFEADRDNYDIIIDNEPACLIGSPGILDKPEEIEVLLDIIENIDKKDPMIKYL